MVLKVRPPFMIVEFYEVTRQFTFAGKTYPVGASFPYARLAHDQRKLRQLYENRQLSLPKSTRLPGATSPIGPATETNSEPSPVAAGAGAPSDGGTAPSPDGPAEGGTGGGGPEPTEVVVNHMGGGWYIVNDPDGTEIRVQGKDDVERVLTEKGWVQKKD